VSEIVLFTITLSRIIIARAGADVSKIPFHSEVPNFLEQLFDRTTRHSIRVDFSITEKTTPLGPESDSIMKNDKFN
jgi:uncharacterized sodium:solute symporter family permease YidK